MRSWSPAAPATSGGPVDALLAAGHDVVVLDDLLHRPRAGPSPRRPLVAGHLRRRGRHRRDLLEPSRASTRSSTAPPARSSARAIRDPAKYYRDNVAGGVALLEAARAAGVLRVVFSLDGGRLRRAGRHARSPRTPRSDPINPYGETKRTFEGALRWYGRAYGLRSVILRYFNVAGATERLGEVHRPETHLIPNVLLAAEGGRPLTLFGEDYPTPDGTPIRDYIHVEDLADAHLAALEATGHRGLGPDGAEPGAPVSTSARLGFSRARGAPGGGDGRRPADPARHRSASGRRPAGPRRLARARRPRSSAGRRGDPRLAEMIGSAWAWRQAHPGGYDAAG